MYGVCVCMGCVCMGVCIGFVCVWGVCMHGVCMYHHWYTAKMKERRSLAPPSDARVRGNTSCPE